MGLLNTAVVAILLGQGRGASSSVQVSAEACRVAGCGPLFFARQPLAADPTCCLSRQPLHVLLHHDQCQHPHLPIPWPWLQPSYRIVVQPQGPCEWPINCCHLPAAKLQTAADNPTQPGTRRRSSFRTPVAGSGPPLTPVAAATVPSQLWDTSAVAWKASRKTWGSTFSPIQ